jgi:2-dehydropantoate 2-reductase
VGVHGEIMKVVVFGAGSLGSLIGGLLARVHDVTLVGREPHVRAIEADGLRISGAVAETPRPSAATDVPATADLALVTVKAYDTPAAVGGLSACDAAAVLSLQNGLGNEERLATGLDSPVLAGTCTYGARLVEPGHVECTGVGDVVLGPYEGGQSAVADEVGRGFDDAGIETTVAEDVPRRLWEKLAVNAAINPVTALTGAPNGALATGPAAALARRAARETAAVARANGVDLADAAAVAATERVVADTAANRSSMLQDVEAGRRTEIDAINGAVLDRSSAREDPIDAPVNETLAALIRAWEAERGHR